MMRIDEAIPATKEQKQESKLSNDLLVSEGNAFVEWLAHRGHPKLMESRSIIIVATQLMEKIKIHPLHLIILNILLGK